MRIAVLSCLLVAACGLHVVEDDQVTKTCSQCPHGAYHDAGIDAP